MRCLVFILSICGFFSTASLQALELWVTIAPQKYFVERIGGNAVSVHVLVESGQSPELYAPSAAQLAKLAKSDAYIGIGLAVEHKVLPRIEASMPHVRVLQAGVLSEDPAHDHHHDHAGCVHGDEDPHVWMDPMAMVAFVEQVQAWLIELAPAEAERFEANALALVTKLKALDVKIQAQLLPYAGRAFYINHPALGHFAERYALEQRSLELAGTAPSARRLAELVKVARRDKIGAIFTQPEFGRSSADVLARALKVGVIELNPLAEDYVVNLQQIADALEGSFTR